jgi:amino acid transporter
VFDPAPDAKSEQQLSRLGYAQELLRSMGGFSSFALSFSIISVLTGVFSTYKIAIQAGGPAGLGLGWPVVCVGTMLVALAMAELASAFPTAGALYHWSALLGGRSAGWMVAVMNLVGQVAIVAAIDFACAKALASTLALGDHAQLPLFFAIVATHAAINLRSIRLVAWLNDFSATVHIVGVIVLVALLAVFGHAQPASFLGKTSFTLREDHDQVLGFLNALTLGMWTMTGFDASAHASEETHDPAMRAPRGIVSSVAVSAVAGYLLVCALTLAIKDLPAVAHDDDPALAILRGAVGERAGRVAMGAAIVAMWFCGLSSITSASRTFYALARDGGLPWSRVIARVSPRYRTPPPAIVMAAVLPCVLVAVTSRFSDAVFDAVTSLATTALYVSYAAPIALGVVARLRGTWTRLGPWNLGRASIPIACTAVLYSAFVLVCFGLPPNQAYAKLIGAVAVVIAASYFAFVRARFRGPKIQLAEMEEREH